MTTRKWYVLGIIVVLVAALTLYVYRLLKLPERLPPVPAELTTRALIPGIPDARIWVGLDIEPLVKEILAAREREQAHFAGAGNAGELPPVNLLAISGGGDKGAFGAGLLSGWTAAGNRPAFKVVTGVSTGALIAPFAFLGPDYDHVLTEVYTQTTPEDISRERGPLAAIENDGMADNRPLGELIARHVDRALLDAIAAEYAKGRLLLVGTTDLDARQPVMWNMGAIAASDAPNALQLFTSILLASAAIPGAFPPTMIRVEVDGRVYEEMHVDGGASTQVFLYPPGIFVVSAEMREESDRGGSVYVIRNSTLQPVWDPARRQTIGIASRAIASLIQTQGMGDLHRIYVTTQRDGLDFNLAIIGDDFVYAGKPVPFETTYMRALHTHAYDLAREGYPWQKFPPGLDGPYGR